jgi:hypothetical protein
MTTSPISDLLFGENNLKKKFAERKNSRKTEFILKKSPKTTTIAYIPKGA